MTPGREKQKGRNMSRLPKAMFFTGLDDLATKFLKNTRPTDERQIAAAIALEMASVAEAIIFSPKVTFKVYGENVVLSLLVKAFGTKGVQELLETDAIEFALWTPMVTYTDDEYVLGQGVTPIQAGVLQNPEHSDPKVSANAGLEGWCRELHRPERRLLSKLASRKTYLPPKELSHRAVATVVDSYRVGTLNTMGFRNETPIHQIDAAQRRQLARLADSAVEACILLDRDLDVFERESTWQMLVTLIHTYEARGILRDAVESVLDIERLPSISGLILSGQINWGDVLRIRRRRETKDFRRWLWSQPDPKDCSQISAEYVRQIAPKADIQYENWFKAARISAVSAAGGVLGTLTAGPNGGMTGAAVGTAVGTAVSLFDGIFLDKLLNKPSPRRFATDVISPLLVKSIAPDSEPKPNEYKFSGRKKPRR
jgi:hypothetical protein